MIALKHNDKIKVWIDFEDNRVRCICPFWRKRCKKECVEEVVTRDRYYGWRECLRVDKYGKVKGGD